MPARLVFPFAAIFAIIVLLLTVLGGASFPGYSHMSQFISELGATGAPHEILIRFAGFLPAGVFLWLFTLCAFLLLPRSRLTTLGLIGIFLYAGGYVIAAFFPCDLGCRPAQPSSAQAIHNFFGLIGYVAAPVSLLALGRSARSWPGGSHLAIPAFVAAGFSLLGLLTLAPESTFVGLSQRFIEASVMLWVVACAWYTRSRIAA